MKYSPKNLTKAGLEKIVREMVELFKKYHACENISFVYNNKRVSYGDSAIDWEATKAAETINPDADIIFKEPKISIKEGNDIKPSRWGGNDATILVQYDGGMFYSIWSGEFGYDTRNKIEEELETILGPYHLGIEEVDNVSFTLYGGYVPSYETVAEKLSKR